MTDRIVSNIAGTSSSTFRIGKRGSSVICSDMLPDASDGSDGDLYVLKSAHPRIFQKRGSWYEVGTKNIQHVTGSGSLKCVYAEEVMLCNHISTCNIEIDCSDAYSGYVVTIKDISNGASSNNIVITTSDTSLLDGGTSITIASNMGSVTLLYDGYNFWKI